MAADQEISL